MDQNDGVKHKLIQQTTTEDWINTMEKASGRGSIISVEGFGESIFITRKMASVEIGGESGMPKFINFHYGKMGDGENQ